MTQNPRRIWKKSSQEHKRFLCCSRENALNFLSLEKEHKSGVLEQWLALAIWSEHPRKWILIVISDTTNWSGFLISQANCASQLKYFNVLVRQRKRQTHQSPRDDSSFVVLWASSEQFLQETQRIHVDVWKRLFGPRLEQTTWGNYDNNGQNSITNCQCECTISSVSIVWRAFPNRVESAQGGSASGSSRGDRWRQINTRDDAASV